MTTSNEEVLHHPDGTRYQFLEVPPPERLPGLLKSKEECEERLDELLATPAYEWTPYERLRQEEIANTQERIRRLERAIEQARRGESIQVKVGYGELPMRGKHGTAHNHYGQAI